jgi:hypothetical protein
VASMAEVTASCSSKSPDRLFWLWRLAWLGRGGPRCFVATECGRGAPCWSCKGRMGVTPAPSESSVRPLPVPATVTSCGAEFLVEDVVVVSVCACWSSSERSASLSLSLIIRSVRWCLSVKWVSCQNVFRRCFMWCEFNRCSNSLLC